MRVLSLKRLREFWSRADAPAGAERFLRAWYRLTIAARWHTFAELRGTFGSADVYHDCVIFDVGNNRIRLIGRVYYANERGGGAVLVLAVLTHPEYDEDKWKDDCECRPSKPKTKAARPVKGPKKA